MDIELKCGACGNRQSFKVSDDVAFYQVEHKYFDDDKTAKRKCKACKEKQLYYYVDEEKIPEVLGGSRNYMSMERFWTQNKGEMRRKEDALAKTVAERHANRVTSNIDKQRERQGRDKRHQGYGSGQGEQKLDSGN